MGWQESDALLKRNFISSKCLIIHGMACAGSKMGVSFLWEFWLACDLVDDQQANARSLLDVELARLRQEFFAITFSFHFFVCFLLSFHCLGVVCSLPFALIDLLAFLLWLHYFVSLYCDCMFFFPRSSRLMKLLCRVNSIGFPPLSLCTL